jgi:UDP-N-acetylmuramoyl-tripeptide--D-alanyl-D-alanine ligase
VSAKLAADQVTAALGVEPSGRVPEAFNGVTIDTRRATGGELFVAIRGDRYDGNDFLDTAVAAGVTGAVGEDRSFADRAEIAFWAVPDGRAALQSLAAHYRRALSTRVVAVTGSNGKTTTKELIAAVLAQRFSTAATVGNLNNQIGVPLTLLDIGPDNDWAVVELGSSEPGEIAILSRIAQPSMAVITNVAASHLEGLGSVEEVMHEKLALGRALTPDGKLFYNGDDPQLRAAVSTLKCRLISYGMEPSNDVRPERWELDGEGRGMFEVGGRTYRLRLVGRHNVVNALAAVAVGCEADVSPGAIAVGIAEPDALPLRMELERWGDVVALVDCYNANPESVASAVATLVALDDARRRVVVLGEMLELGDQSEALHRQVGRDLASAGVEVVVAVGSGAAPLASGAEDSGVTAFRFDEQPAAIRWLIENLRPGDAVLFKASRGAALEHVVEPVREACLGCSVEINR